MVTLVLPVQAVALDAGACIRSVVSDDFRIEVTEVRDIGQGMVLEGSIGTGDGYGSDRISFQHCESGQAIRAVSSTWDANGSVLPPANPYDIMMMAMESPETITLSAIADQMVAAGVDAELNTWDRETCGCAVFYPEARGDKAPWSE